MSMKRMESMRYSLEAQGRTKSFLMELQEQQQNHATEALNHEKEKKLNQLYAILEKTPDARQSTDIDILYDWVRDNSSTSKVFQDAQEIICKTICREMTLLQLPAQGIVCKQDEFGDIFYIIIEGKVSLYVDTKRKQRKVITSTKEKQEKQLRRFSSLLRGYESVRVDTSFDGDDTGIPNGVQRFGSFIKNITSGGSFGEIAIMDPTAKRTCTIICDEPTSFICLKRGAYQRLLRVANSHQLDFTKVEYLETLWCFEHWPHGDVTRLSHCLRQVSFPADTYLAKIGLESSGIYMIYSGIVQESIPLVNYLNSNGKIIRCSTNGTILAQMSHKERSRRFLNVETQRRVALELNLYVDHDICGEFPIMHNQQVANSDLIAVSDVKVLLLDRETWNNTFLAPNLDYIRETNKKIHIIATAREAWRQTRIKLAVANPGLILTIPTIAMMQDCNPICGWCGDRGHVTGDSHCAKLMDSKKKQADKLEQDSVAEHKPMRSQDPHSHARNRKYHNAIAKARVVRDLVSGIEENRIHRRRVTKFIMPGGQNCDGEASEIHPMYAFGQQKLTLTVHHAPLSICEETSHDNEDCIEYPGRLIPSNTLQQAARSSLVPITSQDNNYTSGSQVDVCQTDENIGRSESALSSCKSENIRKSAFTEVLESDYRQKLLYTVNRVGTYVDLCKTRKNVLDNLNCSVISQYVTNKNLEDNQMQPHKPQKPKVPTRKISQRLSLYKDERKRPDKFTRRINRRLRKLWLMDIPLPIVEDSLRDS